MTRSTYLLEKLLPSIINVFIVTAISWPFYLEYGFDIRYKGFLVVLFWLYNFLFLVFRKDARELGMIIIRTYWTKSYKPWQKVIYSVLYTLSFATVVFWIWFPFDLLLINLLLIQLPSVVLSGTTIHGLLSGKMETVKKI